MAALQRTSIGGGADRPSGVSRIAPRLEDLIRDEDAHEAAGGFVEVVVAVYDAEAPTKSVELGFASTYALTELIDRVPCTARVAEESGGRVPLSAGFLYIAGVLYADHRFGSTDYETPVVSFLEAQGMRVEKVLLDNKPVCFEDLSVQLGVPYVYVHDGNCEHLIIFRDVRAASGPPRPPRVLWSKPPRVRPCDICKVRCATKFTFGDRLADASPFHYCPQCYRDAHYDDQGRLYECATDFRVFSHPPAL